MACLEFLSKSNRFLSTLLVKELGTREGIEWCVSNTQRTRFIASRFFTKSELNIIILSSNYVIQELFHLLRFCFWNRRRESHLAKYSLLKLIIFFFFLGRLKLIVLFFIYDKSRYTKFLTVEVKYNFWWLIMLKLLLCKVVFSSTWTCDTKSFNGNERQGKKSRKLSYIVLSSA